MFQYVMFTCSEPDGWHINLYIKSFAVNHYYIFSDVGGISALHIKVTPKPENVRYFSFTRLTPFCRSYANRWRRQGSLPTSNQVAITLYQKLPFLGTLKHRFNIRTSNADARHIRGVFGRDVIGPPPEQGERTQTPLFSAPCKRTKIFEWLATAAYFWTSM